LLPFLLHCISRTAEDGLLRAETWRSDTLLIIYVYIGRVLCVKRVCLFVCLFLSFFLSYVLLCVSVYSLVTAHSLSLSNTHVNPCNICIYVHMCTGKSKTLQQQFYFCKMPSPSPPVGAYSASCPVRTGDYLPRAGSTQRDMTDRVVRFFGTFCSEFSPAASSFGALRHQFS